MIDAEAIPPMTAAARRWSLAAAISSIAVFGVGIGFGTPLLSLLLETRGTDPTLNGLNAASAFIGVILGPLWASALVRRFGVRNLLVACLGLDIVLFLLMKPLDDIAAWFVLRIALGLVGSCIFTVTEAWINMLSGPASRGRVIGVYTAALYGGFALGPLLLAATGIAGWLPFVAVSIVTGLAMLPLLGADAGAIDAAGPRSAGPIAMFVRAPFIMLAAALFGIVEQTNFTLLPVWGVRVGLAPGLAAAMLTATSMGALALQPAIGWLSDTMARLPVMRFCAAVGLLGAALLPVAAGAPAALFVLLFVWSGLASAVYPLALGMAGERFSGLELVSVNAAIIVSYGIGSLVGPSIGGVAIDLWNPQGLIVWLVAVLLFFLAATLVYRRRPR